MTNSSDSNTITQQSCISILSALGSATLMRTLLPSLSVATSMGTIASHEFGHYISAKRHHADPELPFFIPLAIALVGATKVNQLHEQSNPVKRRIIESGPVAGISCAIGLLPLLAIMPSTVLALSIASAILFEIHTITIGEDSKQWKKSR